MIINTFRSISNFNTIEEDLRKSGYAVFKDVLLTGRNLHFPNCILLSDNNIYSPYDERIMSLKKETFYDNNEYEPSLTVTEHIISEPVFFFIYNVDNYYHFLYDSLPILYFYKLLKQHLPELKILINTSHASKTKLPDFVKESLDILGIKDILFPLKNTVYKTIYVGSSLTHGGYSNKPPSVLCETIWKSMMSEKKVDLPKRIYISRRSYLSKNPGNIGTNYTMRRRCENENEFVKILAEQSIVEVFCEDMSMSEKIQLFSQAELVVGFIGGGMANCIFSPKTTRVLCLITPTFLEVNERFKYSMDHTNITYLYNSKHVPYKGLFTLYTRVKILDQASIFYNMIGEIEEYREGLYQIKMSNNDLAGFSQDFKLETILCKENLLEPLDKGLNSPFICDIEQVKHYLKPQ